VVYTPHLALKGLKEGDEYTFRVTGYTLCENDVKIMYLNH